MNALLSQIKQRRKALKLKQHDMMMCVGMSRQQYQRLESKGNPRLDALALVAQGLRSELLLIPKEKLQAVLAVLGADTSPFTGAPNQLNEPSKEQSNPLADDPWQGLLGDTE